MTIPLPARLAPSVQGAKNLAGPDWQHLPQARPERHESSSIGPRVRHEEDQVTARIVAQLQSELPLEGLAIGDPCFRLDPRAPRVADRRPRISASQARRSPSIGSGISARQREAR